MTAANFQRILHPTDFSDCSDRGLASACALARQFDAELHLLHVVLPIGDTMAPYGEYPAEGSQFEQAIRAARERLDGLTDDACGARAVRREVLVDESPAAAIVQYASAHAIDLITMGTHGRSGIGHLLLGSIAESVVRQAPCPVLTVR